jgi:DNA polymerase I
MRWLLIDGFNLVFRSHFAMERSNLRRQSDQFPTGALHGWMKSLQDLREGEKPDRCAVFFDLGGSDRHLAALPEYKAQRDDTPDEIVQQLPEIKRLTALLGFQVFERRGVEADDLIATAVRILSAAGDECVIVSADKDFGQCVGGPVVQLAPPPTANPAMGWRRLDPAAVTEKFGVPPARIADYLALVGDASDNIPGLKGVGPKTAVKWLTEHGSLEGVLGAADILQPERFREQVKAEAERIRGNLKLVTFQTDFEFTPGQPAAEDIAGVEAFLTEMEMHSTLRRYQSKRGRASAAPEPAPAPAESPKPKARAKPAPDAQQGELF